MLSSSRMVTICLVQIVVNLEVDLFFLSTIFYSNIYFFKKMFNLQLCFSIFFIPHQLFRYIGNNFHDVKVLSSLNNYFYDLYNFVVTYYCYISFIVLRNFETFHQFCERSFSYIIHVSQHCHTSYKFQIIVIHHTSFKSFSYIIHVSNRHVKVFCCVLVIILGKPQKSSCFFSEQSTKAFSPPSIGLVVKKTFLFFLQIRKN